MLNELTDIDFVLIKDWGSGFHGQISIANNSESSLDDWSLQFDFPNEITSIWDAEIVSSGDDSYTVSNAPWNSEIAAGETLTFGFLGDSSVATEPHNFSLSASTFEIPVTNESESPTTTTSNQLTDVDFLLVKDWGSGFQGQISITNNSESNLDTWNLQFNFPNQITNIWDAEIVSSGGGSYTIGNAPWNREIAPDKTLTFGFVGSGSVSTEPQNFDFTASIFDSPSISSSTTSFNNDNLAPELELNQNYQGRATFYDVLNVSDGKGNSGYDTPPSNSLDGVTAINNIQWNGSEASGAFLQVSGPKQREGAAPIVVQVIDLLPERADGLDLSTEAFAKVANPSDGIVNIDYELISPADDFLTPYGYRIGDGIVVEGIAGTNPYYGAVRLNNHRHPVESVDLITEGGTIELNRESDNRFVLEGNYPLYGAQDLVVTDIFGQEVVLDDVNITNGSSLDVITGEQFDII